MLLSLPSLPLLFLFLFLTLTTPRQIQHLPLTYGFLPDLTTKIPISITFNHSQVLSSSPTPQLHLHNYNLTVNINPFPKPTDHPHI